MYHKWSTIWSLQPQMILCSRKCCLKSYIQANCVNLNFALENVSRETALKSKKDFFVAIFLQVENNDNNPATWINTHKPDYLRQYVSCNDLSCNFLSLTHKHTVSHMHTHKYYSSALISKIFGYCITSTENLRCKATAISSILCLTIFVFSRDKRRIKTPLSYCQKTI